MQPPRLSSWFFIDGSVQHSNATDDWSPPRWVHFLQINYRDKTGSGGLFDLCTSIYQHAPVGTFGYVGIYFCLNFDEDGNEKTFDKVNYSLDWKINQLY